MKNLLTILIVFSLVLLLACSALQEPQATEYIAPEEITMADDSVEAYAAKAEGGGTFEGYRAIYEHFLEKYPNSTALHRDFHSLFDGFQHTSEKIELYKKYYEQNPNSAMYAYLYGRSLTGKESGELFSKAIELDPNYFWGHFGFASSLLNSNSPDTVGAISAYNKCVKIDPTYPSMYRQLIALHRGNGEFDDALKYAEMYALTSPTSAHPIKTQSDLYLDKDDSKAAEKVLVDFAKANPEDKRSRDYLVDLFQNHDQPLQAINYQKELVPMSNNPSDGLYSLTKIYASMNETDSALSYLAKAVDAGFTDQRRLKKNPELQSIRSHDEFQKLYESVAVENAELKKDRNELRQSGAVDRKKEVLAGKVSESAPDFSLVNLAGETVSLASLKGKVVVLDFWATWCGPCRMTMPLLHDYLDEKPEKVEIFSVNVWETDTSLVRPYMDEYGYEFNVLFGNNELAAAYQVSGIPTLFVIGPDGNIRYKHVGYSPNADEMLKWQAEDLL